MRAAGASVRGCGVAVETTLRQARAEVDSPEFMTDR